MKRKKWIWLLVAAVVLLLAGLCSLFIIEHRILKQPPELTVIAGDEDVAVTADHYDWAWDKVLWKGTDAVVKEERTWQDTGIVLLDAPDPKTTVFFVTQEERVSFSFPVEPDSFSITSWDDRNWEVYSPALYSSLRKKDGGVTIWAGGNLYRVEAHWKFRQGDGYEGSAVYYFHLSGPGEKIQEVPPELTVWSGEQTITALKGTYSWHYDKTSAKMIHADSGSLSELRAQAPVIECGEGIAVLEFPLGVKADVITVSADGRAGKTLDANWLELESGTHFYEVRASWNDREKWGGSCYYYFHATS